LSARELHGKRKLFLEDHMQFSLQTLLMVAQALASISTPIAILLAIRQFRLVRQQAKKQSDTAAVNFILQAEGQFDRAMEMLINAPPAVIRQAYAPEIDPSWKDEDLAAFIFMKRLFGQVSRMVFIAHNQAIDLGMSQKDREDLIVDWENTLLKYREHPIMRRIFENAMRNQDYNRHMLAICRKIFEGSSRSSLS
jgi:hypothetical protein